MMLRVLNFAVIGALVLAAAWVYRIKFDATVQAEQLARLRTEVRHERDEIAALRAEWGEIDNPARVQSLADRFLHLKPIAPTQFDTLDDLPDRPAPQPATASSDPIGSMIQNSAAPDAASAPTTTGSIAVTPTPNLPPSPPPSAAVPANGAPRP
jgi:hypothetical protein